MKFWSKHLRSTPHLVSGITKKDDSHRRGHIRRKHTNRTIGLLNNDREATARRRVEYCIDWMVIRLNKAVDEMA